MIQLESDMLQRCEALLEQSKVQFVMCHSHPHAPGRIAWLPESLIAEDLVTKRLVPAASPEWNVDLEIRLFRDRTPMGRSAEAPWQFVSTTPTPPSLAQ